MGAYGQSLAAGPSGTDHGYSVAMSSPASPAAVHPGAGDARHRLLGVTACAELGAFAHLAADASRAPDFAQRVSLLDGAAHRMDQHRALADRLRADGVDPVGAMDPYRMLVDDFHSRTGPRDWPEALLKAWVCDGLANDWYAEVADVADLPLATDSPRLAADGAQWLTEVVRAEPAATGRLALWARRLVSEATTGVQRLAADDQELASLVTGSGAAPGTAMAEVHALIARLLKRHNERLTAVGLLT